MRLRALFIVAAGVTLTAAGVCAQDLSAGEAIYQNTCKNCHGPKAQGMASFPKLNDKTEDFLVMRLEQYRAGEKVGPNTALMAPNAVDLSDADITNLAAYMVALE